ncbi:MAG TPA: HlyD family secretion protein [Polyangiaceae bacterium]|jgi:membrane fusion protein (multidrug efflux system)|nr:HlyD family secretion protein [Polyangiaceae bacterium]
MDTTSERIIEGNAGAKLEAGPPASAKAKVEQKSSSGRRVILIAVAIIGASIAFGYWWNGRNYEDTDDAQIDGDISNVGSRVAGTVTAVYVTEDQTVTAGEPLLDLDTADLDVALLQAKAEVAQAEAEVAAEDPNVSITETTNSASVSSASSSVYSAASSLSAAKQQVAQIAAQLDQAKATDRQAQLDKERDARLLQSNAISQAEFDKATNLAAASAAGVQALVQALAAARDHVGEAQAGVSSAQTHLTEVKSNAPRQVDTSKASLIVRQANLALAKARLHEAELNLSYAHLVAPVDGIIGKKSVAVGDHVAPGQELVAISQIGRAFVTANFRETQLEHIHKGQSATIHVDALDLDLRGSVEAIGGATGSRLSILPPENASGNYVKVVQRIPVRIKLDPNQAGLDRLRPGMSVEPEVRVR